MQLLEIINLDFQHQQQADQVDDEKKSEKPKVFRGDRLKWARELKKLTQDQLTEMLGLSQQQVSRYENGVADPMPAQVVKMARILDVTTDWLLGLSEDPESSKRPAENLSNEKKLLLAQWDNGEFEEIALNSLKKAVARKHAESSSKARTKHPNGDVKE